MTLSRILVVHAETSNIQNNDRKTFDANRWQLVFVTVDINWDHHYWNGLSLLKPHQRHHPFCVQNDRFSQHYA